MMAKTNADKAYELILEKIITAEMAPSSVIEERQLMNDFEFGRTPVREALKRLQVEKFVTVSPRRGMFVAPISITDINRIYEIRLVLEAFNLRLVTERITPSELKALEEHIQRCQHVGNCDVQEQIALDRHFHFLTYEASQNHWLDADLRRYYYMSQRIWFYAYTSLDVNWIGLQDHPRILSALKEKDADKAAAEIRNHIVNFQMHIKDHLF
jgi:DNA-binding GntR family transcriptional regulator